jgi:hypothetical protein
MCCREALRARENRQASSSYCIEGSVLAVQGVFRHKLVYLSFRKPIVVTLIGWTLTDRSCRLPVVLHFSSSFVHHCRSRVYEVIKDTVCTTPTHTV